MPSFHPATASQRLGKLLGATVVLSVLLLSSCSGRDSASTVAAAAGRGGGGAAVPVITATVVDKAMPVNLRAVGNAEAMSTVEVRAQVTGQLLEVAFKEGDEVAAGQPLFRLDPRPFQAALSQAEAALARDTAQATNAEVQRGRLNDLAARGLVAKSDYESAAASAAALAAATKVDQAQVDNARLQLQYASTAAPVSGRTGALLVHQGSLVRANDTTPLVVINQIAPIYVSFAVPARALADVQSHDRRGPLLVDATVPGSTASPAAGQVSFIDNAVDAGTDTVKVKATFPNADRQLWPGQFVEVTLRLAVEPHAIVVPANAVQPSQQGAFVYVVGRDQTVEARPVKVDRTEGDEVVVASGLKPGEIVVTDGQLRLTPGARVTTNTGAGAPKAAQ